MSSGTETSTVLSDAERRVVTIKTEANDIVKYSGNPAELPGTKPRSLCGAQAPSRSSRRTFLVDAQLSWLFWFFSKKQYALSFDK